MSQQVSRPVRIKEPLPPEADQYPAHVAHRLMGKRGLSLGRMVHPTWKVEVERVSIDGRVINIFPSWLEDVLPRGGYF